MCPIGTLRGWLNIQKHVEPAVAISENSEHLISLDWFDRSVSKLSAADTVFISSPLAAQFEPKQKDLRLAPPAPMEAVHPGHVCESAVVPGTTKFW